MSKMYNNHSYYFESIEEEKVDPCANITCSHPLQKCKTKDDGKPVCSCTHLACPRILEPVCGDDGQNYHSKCTMDMLSCEANKIVSVDYVGQCEKDITSSKYQVLKQKQSKFP